MSGGAGNDRIMAAGGGRDRVSCGSGFDRVVADSNDRVGGACESRQKALSSTAGEIDTGRGPHGPRPLFRGYD